MKLKDLMPYLGRHCQVMLQCQACGRTHTHEGMLATSHQPGELQLGEHRFSAVEIRAFVPTPARDPVASTIVSRQAFDLVWIAGLLLAAAGVLRMIAV